MECAGRPRGERLEPLGAAEDLTKKREGAEGRAKGARVVFESDRLRSLEEEQDLLDASLLALTSHFAQVQFRLRQIVEAPQGEREELLRSLEEFAFKGVPEVVGDQWGRVVDRAFSAESVRERRNEQQELLGKLRRQVQALETCPAASYTATSPTRKQQFLLVELIARLDLQLGESDCLGLSKTEVKERVDRALKPISAREKLLSELRMQVADLELFVGYLQDNLNALRKSCSEGLSFVAKKTTSDAFKVERTILGVVYMVLGVLQFLLMVTTACKPPHGFEHSTKTHWGNLRAELEMAVAKVVILARTYARPEDITTAVRKRLSNAIAELVKHGTQDTIFKRQGLFASPFASCFLAKNAGGVHPWDVILRYYRLKGGDLHAAQAARKLSESYDLRIVDPPFPEESNLLAAINAVAALHAPYTPCKDSRFRAFVCTALNAGRLSPWFRLIFRCDQLIDQSYHRWSYAAETRFGDAVESMDVLDGLAFDLPVDYAVRRFRNIEHLFS